MLLFLLPLFILQLASSSPLDSPPSLFWWFLFHCLFSLELLYETDRRVKGKPGEGRRKGGKEVGSNVSILSTSSLKLLLSTVSFLFFFAINNIKVGQVYCICVAIQACVGVRHCPEEQVAYTALNIKRRCNTLPNSPSASQYLAIQLKLILGTPNTILSVAIMRPDG